MILTDNHGRKKKSERLTTHLRFRSLIAGTGKVHAPLQVHFLDFESHEDQTLNLQIAKQIWTLGSGNQISVRCVV